MKNHFITIICHLKIDELVKNSIHRSCKNSRFTNFVIIGRTDPALNDWYLNSEIRVFYVRKNAHKKMAFDLIGNLWFSICLSFGACNLLSPVYSG